LKTLFGMEWPAMQNSCPKQKRYPAPRVWDARASRFDAQSPENSSSVRQSKSPNPGSKTLPLREKSG